MSTAAVMNDGKVVSEKGAGPKDRQIRKLNHRQNGSKPIAPSRPPQRSQPMPPPIAFSDAELDVLMNLSAPLDPVMRDPFLRAFAAELERYQPEAIGPGLVGRVGRQLQRVLAPAIAP
jgi:hypothetical protein